MCLLFSTVIYGQSKIANKYLFSQKIDANYKIVFLKFNKEYNLYSNPKILYKGFIKEIKDYNNDNFTSNKIKISKNKKYLVMDYIIKGYVQTQNDSILHENYTCILIDIKKSKIILHMQSDCDGNWNYMNQWVSDNKIIF